MGDMREKLLLELIGLIGRRCPFSGGFRLRPSIILRDQELIVSNLVFPMIKIKYTFVFAWNECIDCILKRTECNLELEELSLSDLELLIIALNDSKTYKKVAI